MRTDGPRQNSCVARETPSKVRFGNRGVRIALDRTLALQPWIRGESYIERPQRMDEQLEGRGQLSGVVLG